jgi:hypothetical protein
VRGVASTGPALSAPGARPAWADRAQRICALRPLSASTGRGTEVIWKEML